MRSKWYLLSLLMLMVLVVSIGAISAADNSTVSNMSSEIADSGNLNVSSNNDISILEDSNNKTNIKSDSHVSGNSESDFRNAINSNNNTVIYLDNQTFYLDTMIFTNGNRNLTICGGSSLDDGKTSVLTRNLNSSSGYYPEYMYFSGGNLTFKNIIFSDIICDCFISSRGNLTFENVSFINIKSISQYYIFNIIGKFTFRDCNFVNFTNGTIGARLGSSSCLFDNCSFENCNTPIRIDERSNKSNYNITNSRFNNCSGVLVWGPYNLKNCIINGTNSTDMNYGIYSPILLPNSVINCTFINNIAYRNGGAIHTSYSQNTSIINCTFINNSAPYGGAIYDMGGSNISNCIFVNNSATFAGGAISGSPFKSSLLNNCTFQNNSARVCGGAILVAVEGNFTVSNSTFSGNNASDYGNDIYYYISRRGNETVSQLKLLNNSENLELYINNDSAGYIFWNYRNTVVNLENNTTGFCLELNLAPPVYFYAHFNNTNLAINVINHEYVGDYLKYLIYNYYGEISNDILSYAIWSFTNYPYFDSNSLDNISLEYFSNAFYYNKNSMPSGAPRANALLQLPNFDNELDLLKYLINDTLNSVDNGVIIPDNGATKLNDDGSYTVYDFDSIFSSASQNLITVKTSNLSNITPDISIIKITNNPVVYKGNDTSFDIVVTNNGTIMLSNVTVTEDSYDDLVYKSSSNITGNWTYNYVDGKHTWTLVGYLGVNQSARFNVVFSTNNSTLGNKTNIVSVTTNENVTGNASNITEVIENNTPENPNNNTPNTTENNTPNKPTPIENKSVENNNTLKADIKTTEPTGYPFIALIIALIGIIGTGFRKR